MPKLPAGLDANSDHVPQAEEPSNWLAFLGAVWGSDAQSIDALQEFFGLCMSGNIAVPKILMLIGPPMSGKSTLIEVLAALLGDNNVAVVTISELSSVFGWAPLIGKRLAIIPDARWEGRSGNAAAVKGLLSAVSGAVQTIHRKHQAAWSGRLGMPFCLISNYLPALGNCGQELASRSLVIQTPQSFRGDVDHALLHRLMLELPAILSWANIGAQRLAARGRFLQPASAEDALHSLTEDASTLEPA